MKSNKEKVYDFIRLHDTDEKSGGVSTAYIAEAFSMQRTNVSRILNALVQEGKIHKTVGRPVLYRSGTPEETRAEDCFAELIGKDGSLRHAVQLVKAAVLYPKKSLNTIIVGARGTGKRRMAELMYQYAAACRRLPENAAYIQMNCKDFSGAEKRAETELFGENGSGGLWKQAECGMLYLDNVQYLGGGLRRFLVGRIQEEGGGPVVIISCTEESQIAEEEVLAKFPMIIHLPTLAERPITERMEMIQSLFSREASRIGRRLIVKEELFRCLLFYDCEANYHQLKGDIRMGCANAYVREYRSQEDILLYISDFEHRVRGGLLRWGTKSVELDRLLPGNCSYSFDGNRIYVQEDEEGNLYERLHKKAVALDAEGLTQEEIYPILSEEVERSFGQYQKELVKEVGNREQLAVLVERRLVELVDVFMRRAETELARTLDDNIFYGLCLHLKSVLSGNDGKKFANKGQMVRFRQMHQKEYGLGVELAERIYAAYGTMLPEEEIILITMFLCYEVPMAQQNGSPVILFAFYGEGIASSIVNTIVGLTHFENVYSFEPIYAADKKQNYDSLKRCISEIHRGKGVYVVYDGDFLPEMLDEIAEDTGILIRQFPAPVTTMGIELARKAFSGIAPDEAYQEVLCGINAFAKEHRNYIVTLCTTGKGGAEEIKNYIERYGELENIQVIPLSMNDRAALKEEFRRLLRKGTIRCVVGTYDPELFSIPFCSVGEVFRTPKEQLPALLRAERMLKEQLDYTAIFEYLGQQLVHVDIAQLKKVLLEVLKEINKTLGEMSLDTEAGLLLHLACCIDRLKGNGVSPVNPRKSAILNSHGKEFRRLLKLLRPLEKNFHIIINDDEAANILAIIYHL